MSALYKFQWLPVQGFLIIVLTAVALTLSTNALAEGIETVDPVGQPAEQRPIIRSADRVLALPFPLPPTALDQLLKRDEARLSQVLRQGDPVEAATAQELVQTAEAVLHIRTQHHGEHWWETIDARYRLMDLRKWLAFTPAQRKELAKWAELDEQVWRFYGEGKYKEALVPAEKTLDIDRRIWGEGHRHVAVSLSNLAMLYSQQGAYAEALLLSERALAIAVEVLGLTHPTTGKNLNNLAELYRNQGQYAQALPLYERALVISEQALGETHPNTAAPLNNMGELYQAQGQYAQAEPLLTRALAIREQGLGLTNPETAQSLNNLAALYRYQGQYTRALPLYQRALVIWEHVLGPTHPETATSLNNLAELYLALGQYAQAEPLLERALAIRERVLGPTHPYTATSLINLAGLYRDQGQYMQAKPLVKRALAITEEALGPTHPETAASLNHLAELYWDQGQYTQAEPLVERALAITEEALGPTHPETARSLNSLAKLYVAQGQYAQAEPLLERALAICEQVLGPTHPYTATSLNDLAALYLTQGQYAQAKPLLEQALAIREQVLGPTHPYTATSLNDLSKLYWKQGEYAQAELLLKRALTIHEHILGPTHPYTARNLVNLGILQTHYQPNAQAAEWLRRSGQSRWRYLTESFPALTAREQQQFLIKNELHESDVMWQLMAQVLSLDRAVAYQVTLWHKQLLAEVMRHESRAFQGAIAKASPEWQARWREREALRRTYAIQALHALSNMIVQDGREPRQAVQAATGELAIRLEELEKDLRRENPAYAHTATLQDITVAQVQQQLKPDQALLEYVQFHPYDERTKQFATTMHYGVYVVRGGQTSVVAVDLGDSAPIDEAILAFHKGMRVAKRYPKEQPSEKQLKKAEADLAKAASTLRRLIWQPLEKVLPTVTRIYVAPDGQLSVFPFEALARKTKRGTWQYLVEEQRELVYLNTGRDLTRLTFTADSTSASNVSARSAVLIGNPKFNARPKDVARVVAGLPTAAPMRMASNAAEASGTLGAVPSQDELRIPRDWPQVRELDTLLTHAEQQLRRTGWTVTTWRDQLAVEPAVLQLQAPRVLQIATHGYLLERATPEQIGNWDNPLLRSMLLLAGVNHATPEQTAFYRVGKNLLTETEAEQRQLSAEVRQQARIDIGDGVLTAYEVSGMNLHGTELVNLTACKTGLGEVTPEGVVGLRQAFFFAGARALTTSLWEVPVAEATQQIEDFYARWLGGTEGKLGMTRYAAFRQTQLAALAQARKTYGAGHPFFWAGFIYLGDPGDLSIGNPASQPSSRKTK